MMDRARCSSTVHIEYLEYICVHQYTWQIFVFICMLGRYLCSSLYVLGRYLCSSLCMIGWALIAPYFDWLDLLSSRSLAKICVRHVCYNAWGLTPSLWLVEICVSFILWLAKFCFHHSHWLRFVSITCIDWLWIVSITMVSLDSARTCAHHCDWL